RGELVAGREAVVADPVVARAQHDDRGNPVDAVRGGRRGVADPVVHLEGDLSRAADDILQQAQGLAAVEALPPRDNEPRGALGEVDEAHGLAERRQPAAHDFGIAFSQQVHGASSRWSPPRAFRRFYARPEPPWPGGPGVRAAPVEDSYEAGGRPHG